MAYLGALAIFLAAGALAVQECTEGICADEEHQVSLLQAGYQIKLSASAGNNNGGGDYNNGDGEATCREGWTDYSWPVCKNKYKEFDGQCDNEDGACDKDKPCGNENFTCEEAITNPYTTTSAPTTTITASTTEAKCPEGRTDFTWPVCQNKYKDVSGACESIDEACYQDKPCKKLMGGKEGCEKADKNPYTFAECHEGRTDFTWPVCQSKYTDVGGECESIDEACDREAPCKNFLGGKKDCEKAIKNPYSFAECHENRTDFTWPVCQTKYKDKGGQCESKDGACDPDKPCKAFGVGGKEDCEGDKYHSTTTTTTTIGTTTTTVCGGAPKFRCHENSDCAKHMCTELANICEITCGSCTKSCPKGFRRGAAETRNTEYVKVHEGCCESCEQATTADTCGECDGYMWTGSKCKSCDSVTSFNETTCGICSDRVWEDDACKKCNNGVAKGTECPEGFTTSTPNGCCESCGKATSDKACNRDSCLGAGYVWPRDYTETGVTKCKACSSGVQKFGIVFKAGSRVNNCEKAGYSQSHTEPGCCRVCKSEIFWSKEYKTIGYANKGYAMKVCPAGYDQDAYPFIPPKVGERSDGCCDACPSKEGFVDVSRKCDWFKRTGELDTYSQKFDTSTGKVAETYCRECKAGYAGNCCNACPSNVSTKRHHNKFTEKFGWLCTKDGYKPAGDVDREYQNAKYKAKGEGSVCCEKCATGQSFVWSGGKPDFDGADTRGTYMTACGAGFTADVSPKTGETSSGCCKKCATNKTFQLYDGQSKGFAYDIKLIVLDGLSDCPDGFTKDTSFRSKGYSSGCCEPCAQATENQCKSKQCAQYAWTDGKCAKSEEAKLFTKYDANGDRTMSKTEFVTAMRDMDK